MAELTLEGGGQSRWQCTGEGIRVRSRGQFDLCAVLAAEQVVLDLEVLLMPSQVGDLLLILSLAVLFALRLAPGRVRFAQEANGDP